ncbi:MAG: hypothetical protein ACJ768_19625 [Gaiellaceae bacterium]
MSDEYGYRTRPVVTAVGTRPGAIAPDLTHEGEQQLPAALVGVALDPATGADVESRGNNLAPYDAPATKPAGTWDVPLAAEQLAAGDVVSASCDMAPTGAGVVAIALRFLDGAAATIDTFSEQQNAGVALTRLKIEGVRIPPGAVTMRLLGIIVGAGSYDAARAMVNRGPLALAYEDPPLRTDRDTQDQLGDGATYARTRGTYLDTNRPKQLYRTTGTDDVTADTIAEHFAAAAENVLRNGGGQEGALGAAAPGWTTSSATLVTANDFAKIGTRSLKHPYAGVPVDRYSYQDWTVELGDVWEISGWIRCSGGTTGKALLNIDNVTCNSRVLQTEAPYVNGPDVGILINALTEWTFVRSVVEITAAGTIRVFCQAGYAGVSDGNVWFDGVAARRFIKGASRLYAGLSESGDLNSGIGQLDGAQAKRLAFGFQSGTCRRGDVITFSPAFAAPPDLILGTGSGSRYFEGDSAKWSNPGTYVAAKHQIVDLSDGGTLTRLGFTCTAELRQKGGALTGNADFPNPNSLAAAGNTTDSGAIGANPATSGQYTVRYQHSLNVESLHPGSSRTTTVVVGIFKYSGGVETELRRDTYSCTDFGNNPGSGTTVTGTHAIDVTASLGATDQLRLKVISVSNFGASGSSTLDVHGWNLAQDGTRGVLWSYGGTDITASMTPDPSDSVKWRAYGVQ